jgi:hypothetical protein
MSTAHRMIDGTEYNDLSINGRRIKRWRHPELDDVLMKASHVQSSIKCLGAPK